MGQQLSTNLGLSQLPEIDQTKYPSIYLEAVKIRSALNVLQTALDKYTGVLGETDESYWSQTSASSSATVGNIATLYLQATEAVGYGAPCQLYNNSGNPAVRNAVGGSTPKQCHVICTTPGGVASGKYGKFKLMGVVAGFSGLTPGTTYYLGFPAGTITATKPGTAGNLIQELGIALSSKELWFNPTLATRTA